MVNEDKLRDDERRDEFPDLTQLQSDGGSNSDLVDKLSSKEIKGLLKSIAVDETNAVDSAGWEMEDLFPPEPWFNLKIHYGVNEKGGEFESSEEVEQPNIVRKSWSEFKRFHNLLVTDEFGCLPAIKDAIMPLPILEDEPQNRDERKLAEELCTYFHSILQIPEVRKSLLLGGFLNEKSFQGRRRLDNWGTGDDDESGGVVNDGGSESAAALPVTAIDFLLQPFEPEKLYIHRRMDYFRDMIVLKGESVVWRFAVQELDIDFSVDLHPDIDGQYLEALETEDASVNMDTNVREKACEKFQVPAGGSNVGIFPVHNTTRYSSMASSIQGSFTANQNGLIRLKWSNTFSRLRGKKLSQLVRVVESKEMRSAIEAANVVNKKAQGLRRNPVSKKSPAHTVSLRDGVPIHVIAVTEHEEFLDPSASLYNSINGKDDAKDGDNTTTSCLLHGGSSSTSNKVEAESYEETQHVGYLLNILYSAAQATGHILMNPGYTDSAASGTTLSPNVDSTINSLPDNEVTHPMACVTEICATYSKLEDELAIADVKRTQADTHVRLVLAKLLKKEVEEEKLRTELKSLKEDVLVTEQLAECRALERDECRRDLEHGIEDKEKLDEAMLKVERDNEFLRAERNVWRMARSGIQAELSKVVNALGVEKQGHDDTRRLLARAQEAFHREELENHHLAAKLKEQADRRVLEMAQEEAKISGQAAEDSNAALVELKAEIANLDAQKNALARELKKKMKVFQDKLSTVNAEAEEARMMQRTMQSHLKALEEECEAHIAIEAENEIKIQRLRAEKKLLVSEIRRGSTPSAVIDSSPASIEDVHVAHVSLPSLNCNLDVKDIIKQLSRQIVYLRKRKMQLQEHLDDTQQNGHGDDDHNKTPSLIRQVEDIDRAVIQLQSRVKRLMSTEREGCDD